MYFRFFSWYSWKCDCWYPRSWCAELGGEEGDPGWDGADHHQHTHDNCQGAIEERVQWNYLDGSHVFIIQNIVKKI